MSDDPTPFLWERWNQAHAELTADDVDDPERIQQLLIESAIANEIDTLTSE